MLPIKTWLFDSTTFSSGKSDWHQQEEDICLQHPSMAVHTGNHATVQSVLSALQPNRHHQYSQHCSPTSTNLHTDADWLHYVTMLFKVFHKPDLSDRRTKQLAVIFASKCSACSPSADFDTQPSVVQTGVSLSVLVSVWQSRFVGLMLTPHLGSE